MDSRNARNAIERVISRRDSLIRAAEDLEACKGFPREIKASRLFCAREKRLDAEALTLAIGALKREAGIA